MSEVSAFCVCKWDTFWLLKFLHLFLCARDLGIYVLFVYLNIKKIKDLTHPNTFLLSPFAFASLPPLGQEVSRQFG